MNGSYACELDNLHKCNALSGTGWPDFRCAYGTFVKNWERRQIFYPRAERSRPVKHCLFMYKGETFKIIGFFLSILFLVPVLTHTCIHSPDLGGKVKSSLCNLSADWRALNRALQSRETLVESFISAS